MARPADAMTHSGGPASWPSAPAEIRARVMTPMVFCASYVPWARATSEAEAIWPIRKPLVRSACGRGGDPVGEVGGEQRGDTGHDRGGHRGQQDLLDDLAEVDAMAAGPDPDGPDQPAEQGVRGARRQSDQPGQQIPQDRADQPGEDHPRGDQGVVDDAAGDGLGDLGGQEGADDVEDAAIRTAVAGCSAPVAMDVAIAFALSWNPLVKSKTSAVTMTTATRNVMWSIPECKQAQTNTRGTGKGVKGRAAGQGSRRVAVAWP